MLEYGPTHTADDDVELETALQELVLNLLRDGVETDVRVGADLLSGGHGVGRTTGAGAAERGGTRATGRGWRWTTTQSAVNAETPKIPGHWSSIYWEDNRLLLRVWNSDDLAFPPRKLRFYVGK